MNPFENALEASLDDLKSRGLLKAGERVLRQYISPSGARGPRWTVAGEGTRGFIRMNSNGYLGLGQNADVLAAGRAAAEAYGAGPGAVRFISGTMMPHRELEQRLAAYHGREDAMIFNAAYSAVIGVLPSLVSADTVVFSDELNHNCIINALRIARPAGKVRYGHLRMDELEAGLSGWRGKAGRALVVTDGVFSMRGDHAPLDDIAVLRRHYESYYPEGIVVVIDDSHGVGAFGGTGRGTEEVTGARADVLVATLGKAFGVNGGYAAASATVVRHLRQTAVSYIYSNPVTPGEAAAADRAVAIADSGIGRGLLERLRRLTERFREGIVELGYETVAGGHPIVPLVTGDSALTGRMVQFLFDAGVLVTGLSFPVVPEGQEEIRFQVSADMTESDVAAVLDHLRRFREETADSGRS